MGMRQIGVAVIVSAMCAWSGCGGSDSPTAPSDPGTGGGGGGGGGTGVSAATITITASGVSPSSVTIASGNRVTFVNNDTVVHEMASDPHPIHTDCPGLRPDP
jgi:plastocyanin